MKKNPKIESVFGAVARADSDGKADGDGVARTKASYRKDLKDLEEQLIDARRQGYTQTIANLEKDIKELKTLIARAPN